jgi:hypothetical protein
MYSFTFTRIDPLNRSRARGMFAMLRACNVSRRRAYVATVAACGRPLIRAYYWDMLPAHTRRLVAGFGLS